MPEIPPVVALGLLVTSLVTFVGGLLAAPLVIATLPVDYFVQESGEFLPLSRLKRVALKTGRNVVGSLLVLGGLLMLVLPGQGLLTIVAGLLVMDFPGRRALVQRIGGVSWVLRSLNWVRQKRGTPPLTPPETPPS